MKSTVRVGLFALVLALGGAPAASADRVDPWLGTWSNPQPAQGDVTKVEVANPAYGTAKAHAWSGATDWGINGSILMGTDLVADYETPTHYIELRMHTPADGKMDYELQLRLKATMRTVGDLHGTLARQ